MTTLLLIIILLTGFYMAWNIGANDVANAMGTSVGSGALSLKQAVIIAGVLEFSGAFFFGSHVSETVERGIIKGEIFMDDPMVLVIGMFASLFSAGLWLQLASYCGWPVSTTHTIIGSLVGFGAAVGGYEAVYWDHVTYIALAWIASPLLGGFLAYFIFSFLLRKIFYVANPIKATRKYIPWIVFFVFLILSLSLMYQGLENINLDLTLYQAFLISLLIASLAGSFGYYTVKDLKSTPQTESEVVNDPRLLRSLQKVERHLRYIQTRTSGDIGARVSKLLDRTEDLSHSMEKAVETADLHTDYDTVESIFAKLQLVTACLMAFSHGANDVANAIGPLSAAVNTLITGSAVTHAPVPVWALALGGIGIVVGLATWGWRVIETIGRKLTELTPTRGFAAEFGAAATILVASRLGFPISATHTLVGAVLGVGFARGIEALNMTTMRDILVSWIITIPAGALITIGIYSIIQFFL